MCCIYMYNRILGRRRGSPGYIPTTVNRPTRLESIFPGKECYMCINMEINWCLFLDASENSLEYLNIIGSNKRKEGDFFCIYYNSSCYE